MKSAVEMGIEINNANISPEEKKKLIDVVEAHSDAFSDNMADIAKPVPFKFFQLKLVAKPGSKPCRAPYYKQSIETREELIRQVRQLIDLGFVSYSVSPYSSQALLVKKRSEGGKEGEPPPLNNAIGW